MSDGEAWESTATSPGVMWTAGSNCARDGTVNSPARRNPKKPTQHAAQSIAASRSAARGDQCLFSVDSISGVMGRRGYRLTSPCVRLIPRSTSLSLKRGLQTGSRALVGYANAAQQTSSTWWWQRRSVALRGRLRTSTGWTTRPEGEPGWRAHKPASTTRIRRGRSVQ